MSKTFIGGAICQGFELEVPAAEEMLGRVICCSKQLSFQMPAKVSKSSYRRYPSNEK